MDWATATKTVHDEWMARGQLSLPPDDASADDDVAFWDEVEALVVGLQEGFFDDALHPRDRRGQWVAELGTFGDGKRVPHPKHIHSSGYEITRGQGELWHVKSPDGDRDSRTSLASAKDFVEAEVRSKLIPELAKKAHEGQVDKQGVDYMQHVNEVASRVPAEAYPVAMFHDTLEDTSTTEADLAKVLTPDELEAVKLVTRDPKDTYDQFIDKIIKAPGKAGRLARQTKRADLAHNLSRITPEMGHLKERYEKATAKLDEHVEPLSVQERFSGLQITFPDTVENETRWTEDDLGEVADTLYAADRLYPSIFEGAKLGENQPRPLKGIVRTAGGGPYWEDLRAMTGPSDVMAIVSAPRLPHTLLMFNDDRFDPQLLKLEPERFANLAPSTRSGLTGVAWHEMGHAMMYANGYDSPSWPNPIREGIHVRFLNRYRITFSDVEAISPYAKTSAMEAFAELCSMVHTPGYLEQLPEPLRTQAVKMFDDFAKGVSNA